MPSITVWGRSNSLNVQKVLWLLGELDLEFSRRDVGGPYGGLSTPEFLSMNPHGRIPVINDGKLAVWESHAIMRYLAATYGGISGLWHASPVERAAVDSWMDWAQTSLQPVFMELFWGYYRTPANQRDEDRIDNARHACNSYLHTLNMHLKGRAYIAGHRLTLADIAVGSMLYRYFEMGVPVSRESNIMEWYARLAQRPAYRQYVSIPFGELYGRLDF